jgi:hypothetical protein
MSLNQGEMLMTSEKNEYVILLELEVFEQQLDSFVLPDGRLLRELLNSDEPGSVLLQATYPCIMAYDLPGLIRCKLQALEALAAEKGWHSGKLTGDFILHEIFLRMTNLAETKKRVTRSSPTHH